MCFPLYSHPLACLLLAWCYLWKWWNSCLCQGKSPIITEGLIVTSLGTSQKKGENTSLKYWYRKTVLFGRLEDVWLKVVVLLLNLLRGPLLTTKWWSFILRDWSRSATDVRWKLTFCYIFSRWLLFYRIYLFSQMTMSSTLPFHITGYRSVSL